MSDCVEKLKLLDDPPFRPDRAVSAKDAVARRAATPGEASVTAEAWRVLRFLAVGGLNTGFGYVCYAGFVLAGAPLWLAVGCSAALAFLFNFMSYGGLVFGSTSRKLLPRFLVFYLGLGGLNFALLRLLACVGSGPLLAQMLLLPVLAVCGYLGLRGLVFAGHEARVGP